MKKKILFLIHTLGGGGAEKVLINLVNHMDSTKFDITLMTIIDTGIYRKDLLNTIHYKTFFKNPLQRNVQKENGSGSLLRKKTVFTNLLIKLYLLAWKYIPTSWIYRIFIREIYDIEVAFLEGICSKVISNSINPNSKKYAWIHVDLINQHKSKHVFKNHIDEEQTYNRFDKIVCVSEFVKRQFLNSFSISEKKIAVRYNPIDVHEILYKAGLPSSDLNIHKDKFLICSVGRLNSQKSFGRLLECHRNLIKQGYDHDLWIIGEGTDYENLKEYIQCNNLEDSTKLLGFQSNPYYFMSQSDLFVCSSLAEGFSTVATEATILGIPIVTTDCSGMRELLGDSFYGLITENTTKHLEEGIKKIFDDKKMYIFYKEQAAIRGKMFNLEDAVDEIQTLF